MANFGLLQGIQSPQVVANLPYVQQDNLDQFAGGLLKGMEGVQNMQMNSQQMQQNAELFPLKKQVTQQEIESNALKLQGQKQQFTDAETLRTAASENEQKYLAALSKINPDAVNDYNFKKAQIQESVTRATASKATTKKTELDNYSQAISTQAQVMGAALQAQNPQQQEQIYQYGKSNLPEDVQKLMAPKFDQQQAIATINLAQMNMADYLAKNADKNQPASQKEDQRVILLENKLKNQTATPEDQRELELIKQRREGSRQNVNPLDSELAKTDAKVVEAAADARGQMINFRDFNEQARNQLNKVPGYALGPIASAIKLDVLTPEAQVLKGYLAASTLLAKNILGLKGGTQGFTEGERKFVEQVAGGTFQDKVSLKELTSTMNELSYKVEHREWLKESNVRKKGSGYDDWLSSNPEPSKSPKEMEKDNKKESMNFQEGQIYTNAAGQRAKRVNGQWVEVK